MADRTEVIHQRFKDNRHSLISIHNNMKQGKEAYNKYQKKHSQDAIIFWKI
jgi:hypothetical protein